MLATGLLSSVAALAGSFTNNFNSADTTGFALGGGALVETNRLILTPAANDSSGSITLDDLDATQFIESFTANFKLQIGPGSGNAADGASFNFGPDIFGGGLYGEEGPGGTALTLAFDIYDSGGNEAPAIDIKVFGNVIAHHPYAKSDMVTSKLEDVSIQLKRNATMTVSYKGQVIFTNEFLPGWAPVNGLFNISARTGGENAEMDVDDLGISTVLLGAAVAPTITANPQSATVNEGNSTNFSVSVDGTAPFSFQWMKNNVDIPDATNRILTLGPIHFVDNNATIKVKVTNPVNTVTSPAATLTVNKDTTPPTVVKANADQTSTQVLVEFSEPVNDTALTVSNYTLDQGVTISAAARVSDTKVMLTTSLMPGGRAFILTVKGVQDTATTPNTIAANTQASFRTFVFQTGSVLHKKYNNISDSTGSSVDNLFADSRYPYLPDHVNLQPMWEYPSDGAGRDAAADPNRNYFDSLEGYFVPPASGDYVFFVAGADRIWLYLSTDEDPANRLQIAMLNGWTNARGWDTGQSTDMTPARSDTFASTEWQDIDPSTGGAKITLQAGKRYYMMAIHHDPSWAGGDEYAVTYKLASDADPVAGDAPKLTGSVVGTFLDPTGASVTFAKQPASATVLVGRVSTLSGKATGSSAYGASVTYQWQSAPSGSSTFGDIAGATTDAYTTPALALSDSGKQYRLLATVPGLTEVSQAAVITVISDTFPPKVVGAGALPSQSGATFDVGVTFDEPLDATSAGNAAHYTLSAGSITGITFYPGSPGVVLKASGLTVGNTYTVTVTNVADVVGNKLTSTNLSFTVSRMNWGVVGGDELQLGNGVVAAAEKGFDIFSDGSGEWGAYDEATFVYEQITGDFDVEVRVEYQDASSQWARAGLIAREFLNFGVDRATQEGGQAGRYLKVHVNPVTTAMGTAGNNAWECNRRLQTGGQSSSAFSGVNSNPKYPDAWCRLQRVGQTFTLFRSDNGVDWINIGSTTWPDPADANGTLMPNPMYVGMEYTPENGNVSPASLQSMFVAKFRDYRTHSTVVTRPTLTHQRTSAGLTITFEGALQSADTATGTWSDVQGAVSPYPVTASGTQKYYRAKK